MVVRVRARRVCGIYAQISVLGGEKGKEMEGCKIEIGYFLISLRGGLVGSTRPKQPVSAHPALQLVLFAWMRVSVPTMLSSPTC